MPTQPTTTTPSLHARLLNLKLYARRVVENSDHGETTALVDFVEQVDAALSQVLAAYDASEHAEALTPITRANVHRAIERYRQSVYPSPKAELDLLGSLLGDGDALHEPPPTDHHRVVVSALTTRILELEQESERNRQRWIEAADLYAAERTRRQQAEASSRGKILAAVSAERDRQDAKWGPVTRQPNVNPMLAAAGADHRRICADLWIPTADRAKELCETARERGRMSFAVFTLEELCEAIEVHDDEPRLREELVQTAACVMKWLEALDLPVDGATNGGADHG